MEWRLRSAFQRHTAAIQLENLSCRLDRLQREPGQYRGRWTMRLSLSTVHVRVNRQSSLRSQSHVMSWWADSRIPWHHQPQRAGHCDATGGLGGQRRQSSAQTNPRQAHLIAEPQACEEDVGDTRHIMKSLSVALSPSAPLQSITHPIHDASDLFTNRPHPHSLP